MNGSRRIGFRHVIAIGVIACTLAACGVKGELEAPPAARLAEPQGQPPAQAAAAAPRVFTEDSRVQNVPTPSVFPRMPPDEWSRSREYQSTSQPKSGKQKSKTDEPFFLDSIL